MVWGAVLAGDSSTDPNFVAPGAVAWLKVTATGWADGPLGGDRLAHVTFIQRLNTAGGVAGDRLRGTRRRRPRRFVPYTADYFFYH